MATKKNSTTDVQNVIIPAIDIRTATIKVVGDSPLIVHKWSEKAKREILDKQMKRAKTKGHDAKDPVRDFIDSLYWLDGEPEEKTEEGFAKAIQNGARFGFPAVAFKAAAVSAGYRAGVTPNKVSMYAAFHIDDEFVQIDGIPELREDMGLDSLLQGRFQTAWGSATLCLDPRQGPWLRVTMADGTLYLPGGGDVAAVYAEIAK